MDFGESNQPDDEPITEHTVVELTAKGRAIVMEFLDILSDCVGAPVSGDEVGDVLKCMRERDGIAFDLSNQQHRDMLVARLAEHKGLGSP